MRIHPNPSTESAHHRPGIKPRKQNINPDLNAHQGILATAEDVETMSTLEGAEMTSSLISPTASHSSSSIMTPSSSLSPKIDEDENVEKLQMDPNSHIRRG